MQGTHNKYEFRTGSLSSPQKRSPVLLSTEIYAGARTSFSKKLKYVSS